MVQMMPLGTQINYILNNCHVIIIITNTQGQIYFKKDCLTWNHVAGCKFHLQPALSRLALEKERIREGSLSFGRV